MSSFLHLTRPNTLVTLHGLAGAYLTASQCADAITTFERVPDEHVKKLDVEHWNTLHTLNGQGTEYCLAGRYADAVTLHEQVLEVRLRLIGALTSGSYSVH